MVKRANIEDAGVLADLAIKMWTDQLQHDYVEGTEFASNCELGNEDSRKFHMSLGFEETNRIICFRKEI